MLLIDNAIRNKNREFHGGSDLDVDFGEFSYSWTCIIVFIGVFLVTLRKDLGLFIKLNFLGAWMIFVVIIMILGYGFLAFSNTNFEFVVGRIPRMTIEEIKTTDVRKITLFNWDFSTLMGMLGGGYYLHNISIPIARSSRNQETVQKDVFLGYFCCFLSYCICGTIGLFGFYGTYFNNFYIKNHDNENGQLVA